MERGSARELMKVSNPSIVNGATTSVSGSTDLIIIRYPFHSLHVRWDQRSHEEGRATLLKNWILRRWLQSRLSLLNSTLGKPWRFQGINVAELQRSFRFKEEYIKMPINYLSIPCFAAQNCYFQKSFKKNLFVLCSLVKILILSSLWPPD